ncbi:MAG: cation:proton antiporter [Burkholderiales bacterium]|nr:cation:proton antiporter [Burkholderiales bacterium]
MHELFFLPEWPPRPGGVAWIAVMLVLAVAAGEAASRWLRLPRIIGYVGAGVALGPQGVGFVDRAALGELRLFLDVALGIVLYELGSRVDLAWLRRNPWLAATSLAESAFAFGAVLALLLVLEVAAPVAAVVAAIAAGTSPAVVTTIARELRARGQVTDRLLLLTALDSVYVFLAVAMLYAWVGLEYRGDWMAMALHPAYLIAGSLALAAAGAALVAVARRMLPPRSDADVVIALAAIVLTVAFADALDLPVVLALLALGALARSFDRDRAVPPATFGPVEALAVVVLFAFTGAMLEFQVAPLAAVAGLGIVAARALGKAIGVFAFARPSGLALRKASLLAVALTPMSGLALVMAEQAAVAYPELAPGLALTLLAAIAILEIMGPLATRFALSRAGEARAQ